MRNLPLLSVFVVMLCGNPAMPAQQPEAYPLGIEQGGSVGGKKTGWVSIAHRVDPTKDGRFRYCYTLTYHGGLPLVGFRWEVLKIVGRSPNWRFEPGQVVKVEFTADAPPVWHLGEVDVYQFRDMGEGYQYRQRGPVPSKLEGKP